MRKTYSFISVVLIIIIGIGDFTPTPREPPKKTEGSSTRNT